MSLRRNVGKGSGFIIRTNPHVIKADYFFFVSLRPIPLIRSVDQAAVRLASPSSSVDTSMWPFEEKCWKFSMHDYCYLLFMALLQLSIQRLSFIRQTRYSSAKCSKRPELKGSGPANYYWRSATAQYIPCSVSHIEISKIICRPLWRVICTRQRSYQCITNRLKLYTV